ncbi:MAG: hypothetical protein Q8P80_05015 [Candidatus Levybacteria bacterium]|nr:hypothetical protein [Candidatus Levybacteria bacterium]
MFKSKRVFKKRKLKKNLLSTFFVFVFLSVCVVFLSYYSQSKKSPFVSPIAWRENNSSVNNRVKKIEDLLKKNNITFSSVSQASDSSYIIIFSQGEEVVLDSKKPLENQISSLQLMLSRLTIEGKRFARLDFRFEKPVISFKE